VQYNFGAKFWVNAGHSKFKKYRSVSTSRTKLCERIQKHSELKLE
jgi:hypothetical protein